ncbi:MAG: tRNA-dihydrouridine synthase [Candidatus Azambacteria bacterium]|nr:tRNA-dihydrouridine synthase [Candidatus Azambacteria bacterium]
MDNFWQALPRPFFALAPMANITDAAFRRVLTRISKPDVSWTEFVSADGLQSSGREKLLVDFLYSEEERPIIAQLFSGKPENMERSAALCAELGFDGIDINMGCPDRTIEKQSAGAALIKNPTLALELIAAAKEGAPMLPVSVKTRTGYSTHTTEEWIALLLSAQPAAITIHARTRKEMSKVSARWEEITKAVALAKNSEVLIIGNGDVKTIAEGRARVEETGCDGVMIGRGAIGNPWVFAEHEPDIQERFTVMREHVQLFRELLGEHKNFAEIRKHIAAYVKGLPGASELRAQLMSAGSLDEIEGIITRML